MSTIDRTQVWTVSLFLVFCSLAPARPATATGNVSFTNQASSLGIVYQRGKSATFDILNNNFRIPSLTTPLPDNILPAMPHRTYGLPGVAILDYDMDGDLDVYVTNGPGVANSLFHNQLVETGNFSFVDVGVSAGVAATAQDSTGVCYGDADNDGDPDIFVLGRSEPNQLFENQGNGSFSLVANSGLEGGSRSSTSCSMGDVDGDGLLDVIVGNTWNFEDFFACFVVPFDNNEHDQLFLNQGGLSFIDVSASAGLESLQAKAADGSNVPDVATITWATTMVDIDGDGDMDPILADDQCGLPPVRLGGDFDRGYVSILRLLCGAPHKSPYVALPVMWPSALSC